MKKDDISRSWYVSGEEFDGEDYIKATQFAIYRTDDRRFPHAYHLRGLDGGIIGKIFSNAVNGKVRVEIILLGKRSDDEGLCVMPSWLLLIHLREK
jgi:hypothetical protein